MPPVKRHRPPARASLYGVNTGWYAALAQGHDSGWPRLRTHPFEPRQARACGPGAGLGRLHSLPILRMASPNDAELVILRSTALSLSSTGLGVPSGANTANQVSPTMDG